MTIKSALLPLAVLALSLTSPCGNAKPRVAVLNFELSDLTLRPNTPEEQRRTASLRPLLEQALTRSGYDIVAVDAGAEQLAEAGPGYLFRYHDLAAQLGKQFGADWVIVGRHSKPSFLFSYLMAHLIRVEPQTLAAGFDIELKGNHATVAEHGIRSLADKIDAVIDNAGHDQRAAP